MHLKVSFKDTCEYVVIVVELVMYASHIPVDCSRKW